MLKYSSKNAHDTRNPLNSRNAGNTHYPGPRFNHNHRDDNYQQEHFDHYHRAADQSQRPPSS